MKKITREEKGITLIALAVTVVVLLILTGVTLHLTIGNNGMITNAKGTKKEAIVAEEKSSVERANLYLQMLGNNSLNAQNLKIEIEKNYGQNTVDVKGNNTFIVTFKETGNKYFINSDGIVIEIGDIEFDLFYTIKVKDNTADIVLVPIYNGTEDEGTATISCPDGTEINVAIGEEATYTVSEKGTYTFVATYSDKTVTKDIEVIKTSIDTPGGGSSGGGSSSGGSSGESINIKESDIEATITPSEITNQDVKVAINSKITGYTLQYSLDATGWTNYSQELTMAENGKIYVRLANDAGNASNSIAINVTNIDKVAPKKFTPSATSTTNSITISGSTTDAAETTTNACSGIGAYYFSIDDGTNWKGGTADTSYTFTGLTQGTTYSLKMKAADNVGNEVTTETISAQTKNVTQLSESNTTFNYSTTKWTNGNVNVTIETKITGYTLQYSLDATNWNDYTEPVPMTQNGAIHARVIDSTEQTATGYATGNITNIDKVAPKQFTPSTTSTTNSITISGSTTDVAKTTTNGCSGIKAYYFSIDNGANWVGGTADTSYTFTGLTQGTTYSLKMKAVDNAGNERVTGTISQATKVKLALEIGDYVNYTYDKTDKDGKALTYSLPSTKSGYSDKTIAQSTDTLQWRILDIYTDESGNEMIDLVSAKPTSNSVVFQGALGYNNGVYLLNDICAKLYSNSSKGITARSINLEDTEKHFTDKGLAERNKYNNGTATYGTTKTYTSNYWYPNLYANEIGSGVNVKATNASSISQPDKTIANPDPYKESKASPSTSFTVPTTATTEATSKTQASNSVLTVTQTYYYNIAFNDSNKYYDEAGAVLTSSNSYWVASRYANCGSSDALFGLRVADTYMYATGLFGSNSGTNRSNGNRLRPVVSLSSSILSGTKDANEHWNLK